MKGVCYVQIADTVNADKIKLLILVKCRGYNYHGIFLFKIFWERLKMLWLKVIIFVNLIGLILFITKLVAKKLFIKRLLRSHMVWKLYDKTLDYSLTISYEVDKYGISNNLLKDETKYFKVFRSDINYDILKSIKQEIINIIVLNDAVINKGTKFPIYDIIKNNISINIESSEYNYLLEHCYIYESDLVLNIHDIIYDKNGKCYIRFNYDRNDEEYIKILINKFAIFRYRNVLILLFKGFRLGISIKMPLFHEK